MFENSLIAILQNNKQYIFNFKKDDNFYFAESEKYNFSISAENVPELLENIYKKIKNLPYGELSK